MTKAANLAALSSGPAFSAYGNAGQTIASATWTKVAYNTKAFDTNNSYDNNTNYRFQPSVAGYYQLNAGVGSGVAPATGSLALSLFKNGSVVAYGSAAPLVIGPNVSVSALLYLNGSTDYVEVFMYQGSGSSNSFGAFSAAYPFSGTLVRAA